MIKVEKAQFDEKNICPTVKLGDVSITLWAYIAEFGQGNTSRLEEK